MKSMKNANWGLGGLFCIFLAIANIVMFALTGVSLGPKSFPHSGPLAALLVSLFFLVLGFTGLGVWLVLLIGRNRQSRNRYRRR